MCRHVGVRASPLLSTCVPSASNYHLSLSCLQARSQIVEMVLSTDMAGHRDLLKDFTQAIKVQPNPKEWDARTLSLILEMLLHLADLGNPARPFEMARKWAERITTEFMNQVWCVLMSPAGASGAGAVCCWCCLQSPAGALFAGATICRVRSWMSAWVFLLLGGMDSIVFGPIRWCVWSFRLSSPLWLPHLKFLFVCLFDKGLHLHHALH